MSYDKKAVRDFCDRWRDKGYEKGETQQFWLQALRAIGYQHADDVLFEHHLPSGGFIDVWIRDANVLIEQKSYSVNLDDYEVRQNKKKTPLMQALDYVDELPRLEQPRFVVTCNFGKFRVYDRDKWSKSQLSDNAFEFTLDEFAEHPEYMSFITDPGNSRLEKEKQVSIKAGELIGKLYDMMREGYFDPDSEKSMHALNVLCVRLVFCLYCEDADLFVKDSFFNYLQNVPANQLRIALKRLFKALDTNLNDRDPYDVDVKIFPYVNGGLFREETEIPNFTEEAKQFLLEEVSAAIDWSQISPTIFGGIFESTLNPETRRSGGMHYTSPENIHKVIDPLFLDELKNEFRKLTEDFSLTPIQRKNRFRKFHEKLCGLTFLDPACGSGNFLTETYICLRKLENSVFSELFGGQSRLGFSEDEKTGSRVSLNQLYGIELNDFAATVAETALWISRLKANAETMMLIDIDDGFFPLKETAHISHGNALEDDWSRVLPIEQCSYIMGNPPFVGSSMCNKHQKSEIVRLFGREVKRSSSIDYVAGWFYKASEMIFQNPKIRAAFVSTNSITFGEQVYPIWNTLQERFGIHIDFARKTFVWNNEANDQAHVHCVIIGFSKYDIKKTIYIGDEGIAADNINPYLIDAPSVIVESRADQISGMPRITNGSKPTDGGNYIFRPEEKQAFIEAEPRAEKYFHQFLGSTELINGKKRYCIYLGNESMDVLETMPLVMERVKAVQEMRQQSSAAPTRKMADRPTKFFFECMPNSSFIAIPEVSSQRRRYIPMAFLSPEIFVSNKLWVLPEGGLYEFGVLESQVHNAWTRIVTGRLKSDYQYSGAVVYNNFVWPQSTHEQRKTIEYYAQAVLDIRDNYSNKSLADLYDPDKMPNDLLTAHRALDKAVELAYGIDSNGDEEKIVAHLFKLYAEAIG